MEEEEYKLLGTMENVREYGEEYDVEIYEEDLSKREFDRYSNVDEKRLCIVAYNEDHCASTWIDLVDVIEWVKKNKPELLKED